MIGEQQFPFLAEKGHVVSLVGGGGKTTLLYAMASHCAQKGWRVLVSTTTHILRPENWLWAKTDAEIQKLWARGSYAVVGSPAPKGKLTAPPEADLAHWMAQADAVFLEADGAKHFPCKAPAEQEPVLLPQSDIVLAVAGLSALGHPLKECCFRLEQACMLLGVPPEACLTPELLAQLLASEQGGRKRVGSRAFYAVLNQADTPQRQLLGKQTLCVLQERYRVNGVLTQFEERTCMSKDEKIVFCTGGGCTAKLGAGVLSRILEKLPRGEKDPNLLVGYDSRDDAAVYRVTEDLALVQTVDFFPPMVDDPYTFGQIAAANALSDVYAMGGEVKTALNLVCFPENMDLNVLGEILRGGAEKVAEAGGILAGGHSIADTGVKYGLSVTGLVDPHHLYANDAGQPGDKLLLTKALGVGLLCTANRVGEAAPEHMAAAISSMTTLNKTAAEISRRYTVHAATDVTGFSFLGHLHEMMGGRLSCKINAHAVPVLPGAEKAADDFLYTAAGQRNRNHTGPFVRFEGVPFAMEEVLFDPQTSGGLLLAVDPAEASALEKELQSADLPAKIVGEIVSRTETEIAVTY